MTETKKFLTTTAWTAASLSFTYGVVIVALTALSASMVMVTVVAVPVASPHPVPTGRLMDFVSTTFNPGSHPIFSRPVGTSDLLEHRVSRP